MNWVFKDSPVKDQIPHQVNNCIQMLGASIPSQAENGGMKEMNYYMGPINA